MPLYVQVASVLRQRIEGQEWLPGQKIPTLERLEKEFQVARVTVRQAVDMLREENLLLCQQGRGTFVADKLKSKHWLELATDWDSLVASLKDNVLKRIRVENPPAFPRVPPGTKLAERYVFLRSLQFKEGDPYGVVSLHLAREIYNMAPENFLKQPALPALAELKGIRIGSAHQTMVIGSADPETAEFLEIGLGAPIAECRLLVADQDGVAIYVANIIYRSDCLKVHVDLLESPGSQAGMQGASLRKGKAVA